jgi:hypothetical protein
VLEGQVIDQLFTSRLRIHRSTDDIHRELLPVDEGRRAQSPCRFLAR